MRPDPKKLLYDVASACAAVRTFCQGRSLQDYDDDLMLRSASERQFEIIGEALTRLRELHPGVFAQIDAGPAIVAFRNRLIHGYDTVDSEIVWDIIQTKLPDLERVVGALMESR